MPPVSPDRAKVLGVPFTIARIHAPTEVNDLDDNIEPIKTLEAGLLDR
jgi:hypothetical protein